MIYNPKNLTMKSILFFSLIYLPHFLLAQIFTEAVIFKGVSTGSVAFEDIDGDEDQDIFISGLDTVSVRTTKFFSNNGIGDFSEIMNNPFANLDMVVVSIAFSDVEGDQDQDMLVIGSNSQGTRITALLLNDGTGNFSRDLDAPFPDISSGSVAFADIDGDEDQDLLLSGATGNGVRVMELYLNNGTGEFEKVVNTPFQELLNSTILFVDVDNDQDQDVIIAGVSSMPGPNNRVMELFRNDGTGNFTKVTDTPFLPEYSSVIAIADVDGDQKQDIFTNGRVGVNNPVAKLYLNDGMGNFSEVMETPFEGLANGDAAFADVDGDMDYDLFISGMDSSDVPTSRLYLNGGAGDFTEVENISIEGVAFSSIAFADVDEDQDPDLLITGVNSFTTPNKISKLYLNNGISTSIENKLPLTEGSEIRLFPNPSSDGIMNIEYNAKIAHPLLLSLINTEGKILFRQEEKVTSGVNNLSLDCSSFPTGLYLVKLNNDQASVCLKFLIL